MRTLLQDQMKKDEKNDLNTDGQISELCQILVNQITVEQTKRKYAPIKHVLILIGAGLLVGSMFAKS